MLFTNTILLVLYATLGASAPVDGDRMQVEHHEHESIHRYYPAHNPKTTGPEHTGHRGIFEAVEMFERADEAIKATATTKTTARPHARRDNNAQDESGKMNLLEAAAKTIGINPKSISEYLANLRNDFAISLPNRLPSCLSKATRKSLSEIEASLSEIPKCLKDSGAEIEISTDGIEVDENGLPTCLDNAGQDTLKSIQHVLFNFSDCAVGTPSASTQG